MERIRTWFMLVVALVCPALGKEALEQDFGSGSMIRMLSPELRRMEKRLQEIELACQSLPDVRDEPWGSRYGYRSADLASETVPDWIQLDLSMRRAVDRVVLMPVHLTFGRQNVAGYGFPKRFKVEISEHADMRDAVVVVDESRADVPNPGRYPLVYQFPPVVGNHVRVTSLKHDEENGSYFWAMEEVSVFEGNSLASAGGKLQCSSNTDLFPLWAPVRVLDGQSRLGMPVDVKEASPTKGYLSARLGMKGVDSPIPVPQRKWCGVDLGKPEVIEQIRVLPLESDEYEVFGGRGFPRGFAVQLSNDPDFRELVYETNRGNYALGYPGYCSLNIAVDPNVRARYVRILVDHMWSRDDWYVFGLAEIQVYGGGRNLSLGKRAFARDQADKADQGWDVSCLVDGYNTTFRLVEWPEYLEQMACRGKLESEKVEILQQRAAKIRMGKNLLGGGAVLAAAAVVAGWAWLLIRQRMIRKREAELMRQQIARDLHDDIGSNLGGIVLLSEIGSQHSTDEVSRGDFETIRAAADEAATSMRDIVWLIQHDSVGLKDFVSKMRQSPRMILKHHDVTLTVVPEEFRDRPLGLLFRRHVFLSFKEILNNVRKHARTDAVTVRIDVEPGLFRFSVRDEGIGFDPEAAAHSGCGLGNLKRRASRVSGSVSIRSTPGKGTEIVFEAPYSK